jgi:hypothetical protein
MECRCNELTELHGEEALEYATHLESVAAERGAWLVRCPATGVEWVEDFLPDPTTREWIGICRLRRFPLANPSQAQQHLGRHGTGLRQRSPMTPDGAARNSQQGYRMSDETGLGAHHGRRRGR